MADKEASVVRIHEIYIKATPAAIWEAITSPEWNGRYGYRAHAEFDLRPGGQFAAKANEGMKKFGLPDVIIDGEVIEASQPNRLVQTWRWLFDQNQKKEGFSMLTYEIVDTGAGLLPADRDARPDASAHDGGGDHQQVRCQERRRRLELDSQRPQITARDREDDVVVRHQIGISITRQLRLLPICNSPVLKGTPHPPIPQQPFGFVAR